MPDTSNVFGKKPSLSGWIALLSATLGHAQTTGWVDLFNGTDFSGLYTYNGTVSTQPGALFGIEDGMIKVSAGGNAYIATEKDFTHYRSRVEFKFATGGNAGYVFHVMQNRVWPLGVECQMASDDVGSLWTTGSRFSSTGANGKYAEGGPAVTGFGTDGTSRNSYKKSADHYVPGQWNTYEIYVKGDSLEIKVNDKVVMRAWNITVNNGTSLVKGKLGLQAEGAALHYRNWALMDLAGPVSIVPKAESRFFAGKAAGPHLQVRGKDVLLLGPSPFDGRKFYRAFSPDGRFLKELPSGARVAAGFGPE